MAKRRTVQFEPDLHPPMLVEMEVTRIERFEDKTVQVWGYVGDYEVALPMPADDNRISNLIHSHNLAKKLRHTQPAS